MSQQATGPRSDQGKAVVARNAVTHGLSSRRIFLTGESCEDFLVIRRQIESTFQILPDTESFLVDDAAHAAFKLLRIAEWETSIVDASFQDQPMPAPIARLFGCDHDVALNRLHRYEGNVRGALRRAMATLRETYKERLAAAEAEKAAKQAADKTNSRPETPRATPDAIAQLLDETNPPAPSINGPIRR